MNGGAVDGFGNAAQEWHDDERAGADLPALSLAGEIVEVRRNGAVAAVVGILASAVAIAWFGRAISSGAVLDWILVVVLSAVSAAWLATLVDARTPLLVADDQGVRLRLGRAWVGLPWSAVARVEHRPRQGLLRDGVLSVVAHTPERMLAQLGRPAARQAAWARRMYGGPLALPLGLSTRVVGAGSDLTAALDQLASRGASVLVVEDGAETESGSGAPEALVLDPVAEAEAPAVLDPDVAVAPATDRAVPLLSVAGSRLGARVTALVSRRRARVEDPNGEASDQLAAEESDALATSLVEDEPAETPESAVEPSETPAPIRAITPASRAEVVSSLVDDSESQVGADAPGTGPEAEDFFEEDTPWGDRVRPIAQEGHAVAPVVIDDFVVEPAADPVVGPELRAARTRLGLSTEQLAERTRIRPHVIEAIEVDDFVPCGGDFYARGHLRTLARVLGIDVAPLLVAYDERYAHAPVDPRRVFEAELATGSHGSIRGTKGGPNWSVLVAVVMALVLTWSVARLVMDAPRDGVADTPVLNGSGGPGGLGSAVADPVKVRVEAPTGGAAVVVRDANGEVVFRGRLAIGERADVEASPPVRVQSSDGSVTVVVAGKKRGPIGEAGEPGQGTYAE
ncbi:helix-turn-helix domain-containing protein [Nocardioides sp. Y6]|uniref:Helix-turn-helix domain-containing protein n=1 Tax=Nocardioides malaquae TaxID=2773426 RepID=A0ABR9RVL5_9ACTN|nr:helix-turn-helix domain-containing protein [Nocardioides malaquae]MBE7325646.1 helix-turn-helix domain-containing protein [Nocardioides malaquae]